MAEIHETVFAGVDTHKEIHALCLLDGLGRKSFEGTFEASESGYAALAEAIGDPSRCAAVGVEGTGSYGAGLTAYLLERGYDVREVLRPKKEKRRRGSSKNDFLDAERAARDAASGKAQALPKAQDGWVMALRSLSAAKRLATKTSTAAANAAKCLLVTAPEGIRAKYRGMGTAEMMASLSRKRSADDPAENALYASLRALAIMWKASDEQAKTTTQSMKALLDEHAPALMEVYGCGTMAAAALAVSAGGNPERMKSKDSFASLCGVSPVEASSGKVVRHRVNLGGDRQANCALYRIVIVRMRHDDRTKAYVEKKTAEGKSKKEIVRCLKRYVANEVYHALMNPGRAAGNRGHDLGEIRKFLNLTQADVASVLEVPPSRISRIERGESKNLELEGRYRSLLEDVLKEGEITP